MKFSKKILLVTTTLAAAMLAGCASQSNILTFTTPSPTSSFNTGNQAAVVNVVSQDLRTSREISSYTKNGEVIRLTASPEVAQMFQQAVQQDLNSKGFTIVQGASNANVQVNIKKFYANVDQGNLRYKVNAEVGVEVAVQGVRGQFAKNFNATRGYESAFGADNAEIKRVLNLAYEDVIRSIYNDNEVANAINQLSK